MQSELARHCTHWRGETAVLQTVPAGQQFPLVVHAGGASQAGGLAMQVFELEQILVASLQSASLTQATQALPVGLSLQTALGAAQSWACVATVQIGLQVLVALHLLPGLHWPSAVHSTQALVEEPGALQCTVGVKVAQSASAVQRQLAASLQETQRLGPPATSLQNGWVASALLQAASLAQEARQVWSVWQRPPFGQSGLARQATQAWGEAARSQRGDDAGQSPSAWHCLMTQVLSTPQMVPLGHCVVSVQATQVPAVPPRPPLQWGVAAFPAQSLSVMQLPLPRTTQVLCGEQIDPLGQSVSCRQPTQLPLEELQTGVGFAHWAFDWQSTGATQWWVESQIGLPAALQSPPWRHSTQARCETSQTGSEGFEQSALWPQPGCAWQTLFWQSLPGPQSRARRHWMQAPRLVSQIGVEGLEAQSSSPWQPELAPRRQQPLVQTRPRPQSLSAPQDSESVPHPELTQRFATHCCGEGQSRLALHSADRPPPQAAKSAQARAAAATVRIVETTASAPPRREGRGKEAIVLQEQR